MSGVHGPSGRARPAGPAPHPWPIWPRVELDQGADVRFSGPGLRQELVGRDQLDQLFAIGLLMAPDRVLRKGDTAADLTLKGRGKFLIGQVDIGVELGMEALARGLTYVLSDGGGSGPAEGGAR